MSDRVSAGPAPVGVVELPAVAAARMLRAGKTLAALTGETVLTSDVEPTREVGDPRDRAGRCAVVIGAVDEFTRRAGLVSPTGRRVIGLPTRVMQGSACDTGAVWRAALLTTGGLRSPRRRSPGAEVECPNIALALALAGLARRLGAPTQVQQHGDIEHVAITDPTGLGAVLTAAGGEEAVSAWRHSMQQSTLGSSSPKPTTVQFANVNTERAQAAAAAQTAAITALFARLDPDRLPAHLRAAGELRLAHPGLSLTELGELSVPPISKDTVSGRLRRLLTLPEQRP